MTGMDIRGGSGTGTPKDMKEVLATQAKAASTGQIDVFLQLVDEVLRSGEKLPDNDEDNLKLIGFIMRNGIIPVIERVANATGDESITYSKVEQDAIKVLKSIINQFPHLLFIKDANNPHTKPLYRFMFPRLITALSQKPGDLRSDIQASIVTLLKAPTNRSNLWDYASREMSYVLSYLEVLVTRLDNITCEEIDLNVNFDGYAFSYSSPVDVLSTTALLAEVYVDTIHESSDIYNSAKNQQLVYLLVLKIRSHYLFYYKTLTESEGRLMNTWEVLMRICDKILSSTACSQEWIDTVLIWIQDHLTQLDHKFTDRENNLAKLILHASLCFNKYTRTSVSIESLVFVCANLLRTQSIWDHLDSSVRVAVSIFYLSLHYHSDLAVDSVFDQFLSTASVKLKDSRLETLRSSALDLYNGSRQSHLEANRDDKFRQILNCAFLPKNIVCVDDLNIYMKVNFDTLIYNEKCTLIQGIGMLACFISGHLDINQMSCRICDNDQFIMDEDRLTFSSEVFESMFEVIIDSEGFHERNEIRLITLSCIKRVYMSFKPHIRYDDSTRIGGWIISCLQSTVRGLRILSAQTIPCFALLNDEEGGRNSDNAITILSNLNSRAESVQFLMETTVMAWVQLAKVSKDERLNVILMKLVDILGSKNMFHSSIAFHELQMLAKSRGQTPWQLFSQFWLSVSVLVVKQIARSSFLLKRFSELINVSPADFLLRTQSYTVPYLVLSRRVSTIERISEVALRNSSKIYTDNLAYILAVLLTQDSPDPGLFAMKCLSESHASFKQLDLRVVIGSCTIETAFEILKLYDPRDEKLSKRIDRALALIPNPSDNPDTIPTFENFLEGQILGIVKYISENIHDVRGKVSLSEKIRCFRATDKLVRLAGQTLSTALPQICACLQSALEFTELLEISMETWNAMMESISASDLSTMLELTISIVTQIWYELSERSQRQVIDMFNGVCDNHAKKLKSLCAHDYSSLNIIPELDEVYQRLLSKMIVREGRPVEVLHFILKRTKNDNVYNVRRTILDLKFFLITQQAYVQAVLLDSNTTNIPKAIQVLVHVAHKFNTSNTDIPVLCSECLGLIGAVDSDKISISKSRNDLIIRSNFEDPLEGEKFIKELLENHLVKAFRSSTDPRTQDFLAYGMQEYLKYCGLSTTTIRQMGSREKGIWDGFAGVSKITLKPLLNSRYTINNKRPASNKASYPIFSPGKTYAEWLRKFALDLMCRVRGTVASRIFMICTEVVKERTFWTLFKFVFPYAALNVVITGSDADRDNIRNELLLILNSDTDIYMADQYHQGVFSLIDYFTKWIRTREEFNALKRREQARRDNRHLNTDEDHGVDQAVKYVESILNAFPFDVLANRSFESKSYARAIMYWEQYTRKMRSTADTADEEMTSIYDKFLNMYSSIDDPDALEGIATKFPVLSLDQQILKYEHTQQWSFAQECYEVKLKHNEVDSMSQVKLLCCLKEAGKYDDLLARLETRVSASVDDIPDDCIKLGVEASWMLGNWAALDKWIERSDRAHRDDDMVSFEVCIGKALVGLKEGNQNKVKTEIQRARSMVSQDLSAYLITSVSLCSEYLLKLHALADIDCICGLLFETEGGDEEVDHRTVSKRLDNRIKIIGTQHSKVKYLLALRRVTMELAQFPFSKAEVALSWLQSAKNFRHQGQIESAFNATLHSLELENHMAAVQQAKLLWQGGDRGRAIAITDTLLKTHLSDERRNDLDYLRNRARVALIRVRWLEDSGQLDYRKILEQYQWASDIDKRWDKGYYHLAHYLIKLVESQKKLPRGLQTKDTLDGGYIVKIVFSLLNSLSYGVKFLFQSLPKFVTIWLDFAEYVASQEKNRYSPDLENNLERINMNIRKMIHKIPSYIFYPGLSQLLSRIFVSHETTYSILRNLIVTITAEYPEHALWFVLPLIAPVETAPKRGPRRKVQKEASERGRERHKLGQEILQMVRVSYSQKTGTPLTKKRDIIMRAIDVVEKMRNLCQADSQKKISVSLQRDLRISFDFSDCSLELPAQQHMSLLLPTNDHAIKNHVPFKHSVSIVNVDDTIDIMNSMQKPKRVVLWGSDGREYPILCKANDDVRKDSRLMEFTGMVNRLFRSDPEALKRGLAIRRYFVVPLSGDTGILEWVPNCKPLKDVIVKIQRNRGTTINWGRVMHCFKDPRHADSKVAFFREFLKEYPAVLHYWLIEQFPEPEVWLEARNNYTRTCAVMSMVGYILGLGDRHGENILLMERDGSVLHVDFDCLFDKSVGLEVPERVPFRLTHNMVDAFGITAYEGGFRRSCETVMTVLRANEETLMTNLETFLHDPIVEWENKVAVPAETILLALHTPRPAASPEEAFQIIRYKICGIQSDDSFPLSVAGHVDHLIQLATSDVLLSQMYYGWLAFL